MRNVGFIAVLVLLVPVVLAASPPVDETPGWTKTRAVYQTGQVLPAGTRLRLRVESHGKKAALQLVEWYGAKKKANRFTVLQSWQGSALQRGQVLRFKLPRDMKVGLRVARKKADEAVEPRGMAAQYGYHRLRFGNRWTVDVRAIDPTF